MVGRLLSFWDGLFSGALLVSGTAILSVNRLMMGLRDTICITLRKIKEMQCSEFHYSNQISLSCTYTKICCMSPLERPSLSATWGVMFESPHLAWRIIRVSKWLGSPPFLTHEWPFGRETLPYLGDLPTMVINHFLIGMILQVGIFVWQSLTEADSTSEVRIF